MSRTISEIQQSILEAKAAALELNALEVLTTSEQTLNEANSTSKVAVWRLWVWIFAFAMWLHEKIVAKNAENSRPQNQANFRQAILDYHDGLQLVFKGGRFQYNLTGVDDADERKIIARCAVLESDDGVLVVKIAKEVGGVLEPVSEVELTRVKAYIKDIKVPGIQIIVINQDADLIKTTLTVYVNPLMIDMTTGNLLSSGANPVKDAIKDYLANLEFDGAFVKDFFRSKIKASEGIELVVIEGMETKFELFDWMSFGEWRIPEAGYFKINDEDLTINYLPYVLANN